MTQAEEDAKAALWRVNQRRIQAARQRVLAALRAPEGPAMVVRANFSPVVGLGRPGGTPGGYDGRPASHPFPMTDVGDLMPSGPPGPPGPPGAPGGSFYEHIQVSPLITWTVAHNLGHFPDVNVYTSGGVLVETPEIVNLSVNVLEIRFSAPLAGSARLT